MPQPERRSGKRARELTPGRPNTLGLGERELADILDGLDAAEVGANARKKRDFIRWPFRHATLSMHVFTESGSERVLTVACRNLSSGGISVLHSAYMHVGTRCGVALPHPERGRVWVEGKVVRCDHRQGMVHEVGVRFDETIRAMEFVQTSEFTDCFSMERVNPETLHGTLVHVESSAPDVRIIQHYLRETHIRVRPVATALEALALIRDGCDLVLADLHLPDTSGAALVVAMRETGIQTPAIIITSDTSEIARTRLTGVPANAFLAKPVDEDTMLSAMAEFLMVGRDRSDVHTTLKRDDPAAVLVDGYIEDLRRFGDELEEAVKAGASARCREVCLRLKGSAASYGFAEIGRLAGDAANALAGGRAVGACSSTLRALVNACRRAEAWPEAA